MRRIAKRIVAVYGDTRLDEATAIIQEFVDRTDYRGMPSTHERANAFLRGGGGVLEAGADDTPGTTSDAGDMEEQWRLPTVEPGNRRGTTAGDLDERFCQECGRQRNTPGPCRGCEQDEEAQAIEAERMNAADAAVTGTGD